MVTAGTQTLAEDRVIHFLGVVTHPHGVSVTRHAAVILRVAITCPFGVTGVATHL